MKWLATPPRIVVVRPRNADNLLAIAESMATFGLVELVAVLSAEHLETMRGVLLRHGARAEGLAGLRRVDSVAEAVAGCGWVVGTTMREVAGPRFSTRALVDEATTRRGEPWALLFGAETNGLRDEDLAHCDAVSFIPSAAAQPSLNLAQAFVLYAYELWVAVPGRASLAASFRSSLQRHAQLDADEVEHLVASLIRGVSTEDDVAVWSSVFAALWPAPGASPPR